ncbi:unnamed protein product, partial [marine sediment metagenome]
RICGINPDRIVYMVYVSSALLTGLCSMIILGRIASAQPNMGYLMDLDSIATVLIGGARVAGGYGAAWTTVIGIFMLGLINNGLNLLGVSSYYQYILKGMIILICVVVDHVATRK